MRKIALSVCLVFIYLNLCLLFENLVSSMERRDVPLLFMPSLFSPSSMRVKGREYSSRMEKLMIERDIESYQKAIEIGDEGIREYKRSLLLDPTYSYSYSGIAWIRFRQALARNSIYFKGGGRVENIESLLEDCIRYIEIAKEVDRTNPYILFSSASLFLAMTNIFPDADIEPAFEDMRRALGYDPDLFDDAISTMERAHISPILMEMAIPEEPRVINRYSAYLMKNGEEEKAEEVLRWSISIFPDAAESHFLLYQNLLNRGKNLEAEEHLKTAILYDPDNPWYRSSFGYLLLSKGEYDEAISQFRRGLMIRPDLINIRLGLVRALKEAGRREEEMEELKKILAQSPEDQKVKKRLEELMGSGL